MPSDINNRVIGLWNTTRMSTSEIGVEVGKSRAAICGIIFRAREQKLITRIASRNQPSGRKPKVRVGRKSARHQMSAGNNIVTLDDRHFKPAPRPLDPAYWRSMSDAVEKLEAGQCRWPIDDSATFSFCDRPAVAGRCYCGQHTALAFRSIKGGL